MNKKRIVQIILIVIALLAIGAVVWLFAAGKLVWANEKQVVANTSDIICGDDTVTTYNTAMTMMVRGDDQTAYSLDQAGVDKLVGEIKGKSGYENDPTCQTILFWAAINKLEYEQAKVANEKIQALHKKHIYANSDIQGNGPVSTYDRALYTISPEASEKPEVPLGN